VGESGATATRHCRRRRQAPQRAGTRAGQPCPIAPTGACPARDAVTQHGRVAAPPAALDVSQLSTKICQLSVHRRERNRPRPKRQDGPARNLTLRQLAGVRARHLAELLAGDLVRT
jgi:hypothetical protein